MDAAPNVEISIHSRLGHEKATQASIVESKSLQHKNKRIRFMKEKNQCMLIN